MSAGFNQLVPDAARDKKNRNRENNNKEKVWCFFCVCLTISKIPKTTLLDTKAIPYKKKNVLAV